MLHSTRYVATTKSSKGVRLSQMIGSDSHLWGILDPSLCHTYASGGNIDAIGKIISGNAKGETEWLSVRINWLL